MNKEQLKKAIRKENKEIPNNLNKPKIEVFPKDFSDIEKKGKKNGR